MPNAMKPHGISLLDYYNGNKGTVQINKRDDGKVVHVPVSAYFRSYDELLPVEYRALELCRGTVLNVGAGTGVHSIVLQEKGFEICALDVSEEACQVMRDRGIKDVRCIDFFEFDDGAFNTVLLLGRNIGMAATLSNLENFLAHLKKHIEGAGQVLLGSYDMAYSQDEDDIRYMNRNREEDRYYGEVRYQIVYKDMAGEPFKWLYVDFKTLKEHSIKVGLEAELVMEQDDGNYLARLTRV